MKEQTFYFEGINKKIFCYQWLPDDEKPQKIIQIIHGMAEHSGRYKRFAENMTSRGIGVIGADLRGHGKSAQSQELLGYFGKEIYEGKELPGYRVALLENQKLTDRIKQTFPGIPVILLGHSMGSMFARAYLLEAGWNLNGVILSGTFKKKGLLIGAGKLLAKMQKAIKGDKAKSKLLNKIAFFGFNAKITNPKTEFDWLTRDEDIVREYIEDPLSGYVPVVDFFINLMDIINLGSQPVAQSAFVKEKPSEAKNFNLLFVYGKDDPVGDYGKGVKAVIKEYEKFFKVTDKEYEGRHEMLNEINRQQVYDDIYQWLENI